MKIKPHKKFDEIIVVDHRLDNLYIESIKKGEKITGRKLLKKPKLKIKLLNRMKIKELEKYGYKVGGRYYPFSNTIVIFLPFSGVSTGDIKRTLLHEILHAIRFQNNLITRGLLLFYSLGDKFG